MALPLAALSCVLPLCAQGLDLTARGGALGQNLRVDVTNGQAGSLLVLVISLQRATVPFSQFDPSDPRSLGIGLDSYLLGVLDPAGGFPVNLSLPGDPRYAGLSLGLQAATLPGVAHLVDELSDVAPVPVGIGGAFAAGATTMSALRAFATAIPLAGGEVLIVGGGSGTLLYQPATNTTEIWDPMTRTLRAGPGMVASRSSHTQTRLQDGRYLLVGGADAANNPQSSCEIFDPATGAFTAAAPMTAVRAFHTATLLSNGRVLVAGGLQSLLDPTTAVTSGTDTTTIYNPTTNSWSPGPTLVRPVGGHMALHLNNGTVLLCGGISWTSFFGIRSPNLQARCQLFNESNNSITAAANMATTRAFAGTFSLPNGRGMLVGGMTGDITVGGVPTGLCETFDPATNGWSAAAALPNPVGLPTCVQLVDGSLLALGGAAGNLTAPLPQAGSETFDPVAGTWNAFPPLSTARTAATVVPLQSGSLAAFGGSTTTAATATNTWELLIR